MIKDKLSSGREIIIKEMSMDDIDECKDGLIIVFAKEGRMVKGASKARTRWIRKGLQGGDFKDKDRKSQYKGSKIKYDELRKQGFTKEQALELCKNLLSMNYTS